MSIVYSRMDVTGQVPLMLATISLPETDESVHEPQLGSPRQLTHSAYSIWDYGVDANTGQIVYSVLGHDGTSDLWSLLPGAQAPILLQECPQIMCIGVAFSPDSKLLAYSQRNVLPYSAPEMSPPRLYLLELAIKKIAPIFADSQKLAFDPQWSPDGRFLLYHRFPLRGPDIILSVLILDVASGQSWEVWQVRKIIGHFYHLTVALLAMADFAETG